MTGLFGTDSSHKGFPTRALTYLYVPGVMRERILKACDLGVDVVIIDLEDAVAPMRKGEAREIVSAVLSRGVGSRIQVRINPPGTPWHQGDIELMNSLPSSVDLRAPKIAGAADVRRLVEQMGPARSIHCLLESAESIECAYQIASAPAVRSIGLGEADLKSDLGVTEDWALDWARSRVVCAARASGLPAPVQSVYANVLDTVGLEASTRRGRDMGFIGRCAIHPRQLATIRKAFVPDQESVAHSRAVLRAMDTAVEQESGVAVLEDGSFVDVAMLDRAKQVLAFAEMASDVEQQGATSVTTSETE